LRREILENVSGDLVSIIPLLSRATRRRITGSAISKSESNITPLQFEIMELIDEEGAMNISQIGDKLQIPYAQMTKLIDKLEGSNLVVRKLNATDRRTYDIAVTKKAIETLSGHERTLTRVIQKLMANLTDEELEKLESSLVNLRNILLKSLVGDFDSEPAYQIENLGGWTVKTPIVKPEPANKHKEKKEK
jgi:DNA-binding MarR family transcriptional regulator